MGKERRRHPRTAVDWPALVQDADGGIMAEMENISANGAYIRCEKPLIPKEKFKLHMVAPDRSPLIARAEVAWLKVCRTEEDIPSCGMGIRFTRASSSVRQFIQSFVAANCEREK